MDHAVFRFRLCLLSCLAVVAVLVWLPGASSASPAEGVLTVRFLDVGQGDAIHVVTPDGIELLIDGGPSSAVLRELSQDRSFYDRIIDVVVATHPDTDHVAGLVEVLARYDTNLILETAVEQDTSAAAAYDNAARTEGARRILAQAGQTLALGASTTVRILSPQGDTSRWKSNAASIVVQVVHGETEFLFTGDAPDTVERHLVSTCGQALESEVLKLGHHGSDTSSSEEFLHTVQPQYAVVSAGASNRYGHPHAAVIARVKTVGSELLSTRTDGTITLQSDGTRVWRAQ